MTKAPRAGAVKTRLQPPLTAAEAAALNACFLRDTADAIRQAGNHTCGVGVYTPRGAEEAYSSILPPDFFLIPQRGDLFGERLRSALDDLLASGFDACCLIDSDSPTVPAEVFGEAAQVLRRPGERIVLGPSDDGGYYLIGMGKCFPAVFEGIDWSTERVLDQTLAKARSSGLDVHLLPSFFDVDDRETLHRLCDELLGNGQASAPETRGYLSRLIAMEGRDRIWPSRHR